MQYFVTIYINPMTFNTTDIIGIPHAFLGLTHTHPDELDKQGDIEIEKYSNLQQDSLKSYYFNTIKKDKGKWYERVYPSILDSNFNGEGFFGFGPVTHAKNHWGKVYENNQYTPEGNNVVNEYVEPYYYKTRSLSTFWQQSRCVFEISKEQYEVLVESIKKEVRFTQNRNATMQSSDFQLSTSLKNIQSTMYYNSNPYYILHNCVTWVLNKLDSIGIEVIDIKEWLPDVGATLGKLITTLNDSLADLADFNTTFRKFQVIDSNLESIKGAKAFKDWARSMIGNKYICYVDENALEKEVQGFCEKYDSIFYNFYKTRTQLKSVYDRLVALLANITQKFPEEDLQGC